ncbi:MAG: hypothetical protein A4E73_01223 [Syntrophaceae bacterium PtaU1.Bin231]|nr:MAG: hypothetical protein A4E73_01223 [Syntrophaceae bacterium PtaU1.Bin231]
MPPLRGGGLPAADREVERQEEAEPHEGLAALDDIGDRLGLQGMECPEKRAGEGQGRRRVPVPVFQRAGQEGPSQNPEEAEGRRQVDEEIQQMVAPGIEAAHGVVQGEGEVHDRPACDADAEGRGQHLRKGRQTADRVVLDDVDLVVEDEGRGKGIGIGENDRQRQEREIGEGVLLQRCRGITGCAPFFIGGKCIHDRSRFPSPVEVVSGSEAGFNSRRPPQHKAAMACNLAHSEAFIN